MSKKEKKAEKPTKEQNSKSSQETEVNEEVKETKEVEENANPLEKELAETKEQLLRVTAEYANFRKRSEKEKQDSYSFAKADTVKELLPVIDNLERALASEVQDADGIRQGVQMTYDSLMNILSAKIGIDVYGDKGDIFDPNLHNAVMHIEDDNFADGEIVDVFQKGYKIGDKIIRAAMVKTAN